MKSRAWVSRPLGTSLAIAFLVTLAPRAQAGNVGTIFVIAMENHNWVQPSGSPLQIKGNAAAPYINSLVTPGHPNAVMVSYASNYQNAAIGMHPSEPNYIWSEAGTNFGIFNDNDPYPSNTTTTTNHLCGYLQPNANGWRTYQEDIDLVTSGGLLTNTPKDPSLYTVPLTSFSGSSATYTNEYNGTHFYNYAAKHNPPLFFTDTNGGNNSTTTNPLASRYYPLQRLQSDLNNNTVARYNWITPNQYNDMHTPVVGGYTWNGTHWTGDQSTIAAGDHFLSVVVPMIMASAAFQNNGVIVIWCDETEDGDGPDRTIMEIVISPLAKGNGYTNMIKYTHSSDLLTWQRVLGVGPVAGIGDAANASDLSDLFQAGAIPSTPVIAGHVTLGNYGGTVAGTPITVNVLQAGTSTVLDTISSSLDASGNFAVTTARTGTYDVDVKASHWLSKLQASVTFTVWGARGLSYALTNGDADGDNIVGPLDLNVLRTWFGGWSAGADLDGDGIVGPLDLNIIRSHFGESGT